MSYIIHNAKDYMLHAVATGMSKGKALHNTRCFFPDTTEAEALSLWLTYTYEARCPWWKRIPCVIRLHDTVTYEERERVCIRCGDKWERAHPTTSWKKL